MTRNSSVPAALVVWTVGWSVVFVLAAMGVAGDVGRSHCRAPNTLTWPLCARLHPTHTPVPPAQPEAAPAPDAGAGVEAADSADGLRADCSPGVPCVLRQAVEYTPEGMVLTSEVTNLLASSGCAQTSFRTTVCAAPTDHATILVVTTFRR